MRLWLLNWTRTSGVAPQPGTRKGLAKSWTKLATRAAGRTQAIKLWRAKLENRSARAGQSFSYSPFKDWRGPILHFGAGLKVKK